MVWDWLRFKLGLTSFNPVQELMGRVLFGEEIWARIQREI